MKSLECNEGNDWMSCVQITKESAYDNIVIVPKFNPLL